MTEIEKIIEKQTENNDKYGLDDGVYDITDIKSIEIDPQWKNEKEAINFTKKYPDFYIASAYETECIILLSKKPILWQKDNTRSENWQGSGFNYGSTNILRNCPKDILILAEND